MNGRFDDKLRLMREGTVVTVSGPVEWEDDELSATIYATISQGDISASGRTVDEVPRGTSVWMLAATVRAGDELTQAPATGTAFAVIRMLGGGFDTSEWTSPPDPEQIDLEELNLAQ
jgi:hypothetical protein